LTSSIIGDRKENNPRKRLYCNIITKEVITVVLRVFILSFNVVDFIGEGQGHFFVLISYHKYDKNAEKM